MYSKKERKLQNEKPQMNESPYSRSLGSTGRYPMSGPPLAPVYLSPDQVSQVISFFKSISCHGLELDVLAPAPLPYLIDPLG
jgi:hypothetical protein